MLFDPLQTEVRRFKLDSPGIPTGFRPKAQGCAARATLGDRPTNIPNRNAVAAHPSPCAPDPGHKAAALVPFPNAHQVGANASSWLSVVMRVATCGAATAGDKSYYLFEALTCPSRCALRDSEIN